MSAPSPATAPRTNTISASSNSSAELVRSPAAARSTAVRSSSAPASPPGAAAAAPEAPPLRLLRLLRVCRPPAAAAAAGRLAPLPPFPPCPPLPPRCAGAASGKGAGCAPLACLANARCVVSSRYIGERVNRSRCVGNTSIPAWRMQGAPLAAAAHTLPRPGNWPKAAAARDEEVSLHSACTESSCGSDTWQCVDSLQARLAALLPAAAIPQRLPSFARHRSLCPPMHAAPVRMQSEPPGRYSLTDQRQG